MARYSRRTFLGGVLASLTGWLGGNALPRTPAAPTAPPGQTVPDLTPPAGQPDCVVFSASGLPPGLRINSNTGLVSGIGNGDGGIVTVS